MSALNRNRLSHGSAIALCVLLSLLLHTLTVTLLLHLPKREPQRGGQARAHAVRHLRMSVRRDAPRTEDTKPEEEQKEKEQPFAKTSADTPQRRPEQADFVGARNTRAASDPTARDRNSAADTPAMHGSKERQEDEEIVTFDQERRDGDLAAEGKQQQEPHQAGAENDGDAPEDSPAPATPAVASPRSALTAQPFPADLFGQTAFRPQTDEPFPADHSEEQTESISNTPPQRARRRYYDPALSAEAQRPGFRTQERKTRSSGRFIFGKGAALNVEASPRGQYEAAIYRRIASFWYAACDEHRGDIIPGQITISLRINKQGRLANMQLISRRGAGVSQQSFTFAAIRRAALPPMPAEVQEDIVGDLLELIFTFHFD